MSFKNCSICEEKFNDPTMLDFHMKSKHNESEYEQKERKKKIVTEKVIKRKESLQEQDEETDVESLKVKLEDEDEECDFFDVAFLPKNCTEDEITGVCIKGDSTEFKEASKRLSEMMSKVKARYVIEGREVKTLSVPKLAPLTIEVKTIKGEVGRAGIKFYTSKKNTIMITKQAGQDNVFVKTLAMKVVKKILVGLISGEMSEHTLKNLTIEFKCNYCNKVFYTKQGMANHTKKSHEDIKHDIITKLVETKPKKELEVIGKRKRDTTKHCDVCEFASSSESIMTKHMLNHQKEKMSKIGRKCDDCDLRFNEMT